MTPSEYSLFSRDKPRVKQQSKEFLCIHHYRLEIGYMYSYRCAKDIFFTLALKSLQ